VTPPGRRKDALVSLMAAVTFSLPCLSLSFAAETDSAFVAACEIRKQNHSW
jgi:hypothetical protein